MRNQDYAIQIKNLTKSFEEVGKPKQVLKCINLKIKKNRIFGLLGPNGAGKTTLIYILAGLLHADKGAARILGLDPKRQRTELAKRINICSGDSMFFYMFTPREILRYYGLLYGMNEKDIGANTDRLISELGMKPFQNKPFSGLSRGMKQKVALAKALINDPELVFLDEPTLGLDVEIARAIRKYILHLAAHRKMTIILTSHYLSEVEELCDDIAIINRGRIIARGAVDKIKSLSKTDSTIIATLKKPCPDMKFIEEIPGVRRVAVHGREITVYTESGASSVEGVIAAFRKRKIAVADIEVRKATLEEAFLRLINSED